MSVSDFSCLISLLPESTLRIWSFATVAAVICNNPRSAPSCGHRSSRRCFISCATIRVQVSWIRSSTSEIDLKPVATSCLDIVRAIMRLYRRSSSAIASSSHSRHNSTSFRSESSCHFITALIVGIYIMRTMTAIIAFIMSRTALNGGHVRSHKFKNF